MAITVKLIHKPGESLVGFVIRLASSNGLSSVYDLITNSKRISFSMAKISKRDYLWFSNLLQREFVFESDIPLFKSNRFFKSHRLTQPKVCFKCLQETGVLQDKWQHMHCLKCDIHDCSLITACPTCKTPLQWEVELLEGRCTNKECRKLLTDEGCNTITLSPMEIDDCVLLNLILETKGYCFTQLPSYCNTQDINQVLSSNYQVLNNKVLFYDQIIKPIIKNSKCLYAYPSNIKLFSLKFLIQHLNKGWPILSWLADYFKKEKHVPSIFESYPEHWMRMQDIEEVLKFSREDVNQLYRKSLFKSKRDQYFIKGCTVIEISSLFYTLLGHSTQNCHNYQSYLKIHNKIKAYHTPIFAIIEAMISGELLYYYSSKHTLLESLFFDENELIEFSKSWLLAHTSTSIGLDDFVSIFDVGESNIDALNKSLLLRDKTKLYRLSKLKRIALPNQLHRLTYKN